MDITKKRTKYKMIVLNNTIIKNNLLADLNSAVEMMGNRIRKLEDKSIEFSQFEEQ